MTPERDVLLAPHTSLRVGGPAEFFVLAHASDELVQALRWARTHELPVRVIGGGSNLLVAQAGVDGLVVKVVSSKFEVDGLRVRADAGVTLANLARRLAKQGFGGLEWAANVPGTVGGAVVNNAGAFGGDTASCVDVVRIVDAEGGVQQLRAADLQYAYRSSVLKQRGAAGVLAPSGAREHRSLAQREPGDVGVVDAVLNLHASTPEQADGKVKSFNAQRMRTQPRILSAGSVFANPEGDFAGKLIEDAGLKGRFVGGAQVSEQHANFIVNPGGASADDVFALMRRAQALVWQHSGIWLRPEIELFGRWTSEQRHALEQPTSA